MADSTSAGGLKFIVVGASVAGLATAIALKASGHNVLVLEKDPQCGGPDSSNIVQGAARVPPNAYKILAEWGLEEQLRSRGTVNAGFGVYKYLGEKSSGRDLMGLNTWDPEMLFEARGDFMFILHKDLLRMLYEKATETTDPKGPKVTVLFGAEVAKVDCDGATVTLHSGEVHRGDAIIGADGPNGVVRATLMRGEGVGADSDVPSGIMVYSAMVPHALTGNDRDLDSFYEFPESTVNMGSGRGAFTNLAGADKDTFLLVYTPDGTQDGTWTESAEKKMAEVLGKCDAAIQKLGALAGPAAAIQLKDSYDLESWVSKSGRVAVLGEAAHPLPACGLHTYSLALEDGVFLGKTFSHTHDRERIPELLYAFEEHRKPRAAFIRKIDRSYIDLITLADGKAQEGRDAMFRTNHTEERNAFLAPGVLQEMLEETRKVFGYDAADDADEWWVSWGRYRNMKEQ